MTNQLKNNEIKILALMLGVLILPQANFALADFKTEGEPNGEVAANPDSGWETENIPRGNEAEVSDGSLFSELPQGSRFRSSLHAEFWSITPELVLNLGREIWPIVVAGRPTADVRSDWASALPQGIQSSESLGGWSKPVSKPYSFILKYFGIHVVQFDYTVVFTPGGQFNEKGRYLANVSVVPDQIFVAWGYQFSAQAQVSHLTNLGTSSDPVAAIQLVLTWEIDTPFSHRQYASDFFITGSGDFQLITPPHNH